MRIGVEKSSYHHLSQRDTSSCLTKSVDPLTNLSANLPLHLSSETVHGPVLRRRRTSIHSDSEEAISGSVTVRCAKQHRQPTQYLVSPSPVNDCLQIEILLTRLEAQRLADVLPACEERLEMYNTILACDIMLRDLKSKTVTHERVSEIRQAYEGWKRSKRQGRLVSTSRNNTANQERDIPAIRKTAAPTNERRVPKSR